MMGFLFRSLIFFVASILACACGSAKKETTLVPGHRAVSPPSPVDPAQALRSEISRIFGASPLAGQVPREITWAPSGEALAFTRRSAEDTELWLHELAGHRERPVYAEPGHSAGRPMFCGAGRLIYLVDGDLRLFDWKASETRRLTETGGVTGARCAPDGSAVAFTRGGHLFVYRFSEGAASPLTRGGKDGAGHGTVVWLYAEEFGTEDGFGWSPDGARLWFFATDSSMVAPRQVLEPDVTAARTQPYPLAGAANPAVRIGVVSALPDDSGGPITYLSVEGSSESYVPSVTWHPDGRHLFVVHLDRLQTALQLKSCPIDGQKCRAVIEERDPRWVEHYGPPRIVEDRGEMLMLSDRSGRTQIHRFGLNGLPKGQVTRGDFDVKSIDYVDPERGSVVFTANVESRGAWGIYEASFTKDGLSRLSQPGGSHAVVFSPGGALFTDTYSDVRSPGVCDILTRGGLIEAPLSPRDRKAYSPTGITTDFVTIETPDGRLFDTMLTRPEVLEASKRYPVVIYAYGGPHAQTVKDAFHPTMTPWRNLLARRGILVFSLDGRGSSGYGREFVTPVHLKLGQAAVEDQLTGVRYLGTLPFVAPSRIGIFGWSFGGTVALWSMLRTDAFRAGAAVAPVTDWRGYDTAYTERYMQRPKDNPEGYEATRLVRDAEALKGALLIAHGLSDDNVHFAHTAQMMEALMKAQKPFEAMLYPGQAHGISASYARVDLFTRLTRFFELRLR